MELNGTLDQFPLSELLTMMVSSSVTGVLEVGTAPCAGYICCRDGQLYHATIGNLMGEVALRRMFEEQSASFRFIAGAAAETVTLRQHAQDIISQIERLELLRSLVRPHIPSLSWVPELCVAVNQEPVQINGAAWPVLALIDGQRSVAEIAALLEQDSLEVAALLSGLIERRLVVIFPRQSPQSPRARRDDPPARVQANVIKRLLAQSLPSETTDDLHSASSLPTSRMWPNN